MVLGVDDATLRLADGREDKGEPYVVTIRTDAQVDLVRVGIGVEGDRDA